MSSAMKRLAMGACLAMSCAGASLGGLGCGGAALSVPRVADADRARESAATHEAEALAPQAVARADEQRALARKEIGRASCRDRV